MSAEGILIMTRAAPYGSSAARDALDAALTCSVFEQPVTLLFLDDGVFQLLKGQSPTEISQKNLNAVQQSLPLYDIERLCVSRSSLDSRGLGTDDLILPVEVVGDAELPQLLSQHRHVLSI
ncbi:tRNA 5-methylaminomethyl-2-thiouridine synthase TusC [Marinobacterium lacunae]|uniref:tRNA 5-methylaminomethyl-2-thiouridine synthase TusC n=1 Tax=Marinobacterium lacunae TaxID=1232683 RepID=A0A081FTM8_9GAMM|nr:sulfurtransferase complex subunit TusC [Marinobacterium lacunae]KEA61883.1 tRNA 5-methylaminomethyl-2-thiouridine synthase TusC [Marinobacterium lacunae]MBR9885393.1 sulfurtransferase complex subunit TusC [Oceanospirillales bacterium]